MASDAVKVNVIHLHSPEAECWICGALHLHAQGLAIHESEIVPDDYQGEWGGVPACRRCYLVVRGMQAERPGEMILASDVRTVLRTEDHFDAL